MEGEPESAAIEHYDPKALPLSFHQFIEHNNIPLTAYNIQTLYRFLRINPRNPISITELESQLGCSVEPVPWLQGFYRIPHSIKIANTQAYQEGKIYGIDASSGAAVAVLAPKPGDHVLDICCAPGAKLCMIADMLQDTGTITGVDISENRLAACRNVVAKYHISNIRLLLADATQPLPLAPISWSCQKRKLSDLNETSPSRNEETEQINQDGPVTVTMWKQSRKRRRKKKYNKFKKEEIPDVFFF
eukprot:TRINITY_DN3830_c0_g1_i1.p1 TRINITY_DN3830_c0_g1~~TRINITY_DN3830_c0_g1_i1.p1  ORF type:complete len:246 (+),score=39.84 TRINITY_DN3830_c0_g1_i1:78-815(+)